MGENINYMDWVPCSIEEAINYLAIKLKDYIHQINDPSELHFNLGMQIRNDWELWDIKSCICRNYEKRFQIFPHADDISNLIIEAAIAKAKKETYNWNETINRYRKHWTEQGVDPDTGEEYGQ